MGYSAAAANLALDAALAGVTTAKLHTGAPGASGTSNQLEGSPTTATVSFASAVSGSKVSVGPHNWSSLGASGTVSHLSLWNGAAYRASVALSSSRVVTSGGAFAVGAITVTHPTD